MSQSADFDACPRCGHDTPGDPSRKPDGDHLVIEEGPLTLEHQPNAAPNYMRVTTRQDVRLVWCSTRPIPSGGEPV